MSIFDDDSFNDIMGGFSPAPAPAPAGDSIYGETPPPELATAAAPAPKPVPEEQLAAVTEDSESPADAAVTAALVEQAAAATPAEAAAMAAWLATRLTNGMGELTGSIPTTLKTLTIISAMAEKSSVFRAAALENCTAAVGAAQTFNRVDPVHGDKPAELVRSSAEKLTALLNKKEGAAALLSMGGGLLSRGKAKAAEAAKMAEDRGRQAAKFADEKAREAAKLAEEKAGQAKAAAADGSMLGAVTAAGGSVVSKAGGVAATAQAKAGGVQAAYADSAAQRKAVRNVAKAAPEEAKAILEAAMLSYTEDSEAASDSKHLETLLSGTHGHAEKEHGPALLEGMVAWLVARMAEPSAHVKFKTVTVLLVLGRQGPGSWFGVCKANDGLAPLLTELSEFQSEEAERAAHGIRKSSKDLLEAMK